MHSAPLPVSGGGAERLVSSSDHFADGGGCGSPPEKASEIEQAAGPRIAMNSTGRMNRISGTVMIAGRRAAFSSARLMRSLRNSAESTSSEERRGGKEGVRTCKTRWG